MTELQLLLEEVEADIKIAKHLNTGIDVSALEATAIQLRKEIEGHTINTSNLRGTHQPRGNTMTRNQQHMNYGKALRAAYRRNQMDAQAVDAAIHAYLITTYPTHDRSVRIADIMADARQTVITGYKSRASI